MGLGTNPRTLGVAIRVIYYVKIRLKLSPKFFMSVPREPRINVNADLFLYVPFRICCIAPAFPFTLICSFNSSKCRKTWKPRTTTG